MYESFGKYGPRRIVSNCKAALTNNYFYITLPRIAHLIFLLFCIFHSWITRTSREKTVECFHYWLYNQLLRAFLYWYLRAYHEIWTILYVSLSWIMPLHWHVGVYMQCFYPSKHECDAIGGYVCCDACKQDIIDHDGSHDNRSFRSTRKYIWPRAGGLLTYQSWRISISLLYLDLWRISSYESTNRLSLSTAAHSMGGLSSFCMRIKLLKRLLMFKFIRIVFIYEFRFKAIKYNVTCSGCHKN